MLVQSLSEAMHACWMLWAIPPPPCTKALAAI